MTETDIKYLIRKVTRNLLYVLIPSIISFGVMIVNDHYSIKQVERDKISKDEAYKYWTNVQLLVERKNALFEQYIINNEKNRDRLIKDMEKIEDQIRELYKENNATRETSNKEPDVLGIDYVKEVQLPALGVVAK